MVLVCHRVASSPERCLLLASRQGQQVDSVRRKRGREEGIAKIFLSPSPPLCLVSPEYLLSKYDGVCDLRNEKE